MESTRWDLNAEAEAIEPELGISISILNCSFVFESFVAKTMFRGFNHPNFTASKNEESSEDSDHQQCRRESLLNKSAAAGDAGDDSGGEEKAKKVGEMEGFGRICKGWN
ncbi:hypothetical protein LINPERPRIM_LOCUS27932 [Linum perenne]